MNTTITDDFSSLLSKEFQQIIAHYNLRVVPFDESEAFLIGQGYTLDIAADREGLTVNYIERDNKSQFSAYTLRPLTMQRFTQDDRSKYGDPKTVSERLTASLRVHASGFANHCQDMLSGDKAWLKREAWKTTKPNSKITQVLEHEVP